MWAARWPSTAHHAATSAATARSSSALFVRPAAAALHAGCATRQRCAAFATSATPAPVAAASTAVPAAAASRSSGGDPSSAAASGARLPPTARLLYKSLLRTSQRFDRLPGLKAALVHPACEGLEELQEAADDAAQQGHAVLASLAAEIARGQVGAAGAKHGKHAPGVNTAGTASQMALAASLQRAAGTGGRDAHIASAVASSSGASSSSSPYFSSPPPDTDRDSPFPLISSRISREWVASVQGPQVALGDRLYWRWMDRFFRRKKQRIIVGEPYPNEASAMSTGGNKKTRKAAAAAAAAAATAANKPLSGLSAREIALPSPPGTLVPFYYLPSRSLVASVRSEFRAFTRTPSPQQLTHILSGGFQVLRYLNEHERQLEDLVPQLESAAGARVSAGMKPSPDAGREDPTQIDPALSFSPFGPPFFPAGSQQLHTTLLDAGDLDIDDALLLAESTHHARADAAALRVDDAASASAATPDAAQPDPTKEQFEVDLDALQADIKKEQETTDAARAAAAAPTAAAASLAVSAPAPVAPSTPSPAASPSVLSTPLPAVPQPVTWPLRPTRHLRVGSFLVAHPALSSPEFHQAVLLITRCDLEADVVEAVMINRPMDRETLRARSLLEKRDGILLAAGAAALARERRGLRAEQRKKAAQQSLSPTATPAEKAAASAREKLMAALDAAADPADPRSYRHHFVPEWDVAALDARFPNAAMFGGPVARRAAVAGAEDEDDGAPLILHRRPDWQSGMGGSIALQKLVAKQPPLIPAVTATDPHGQQHVLAPPVFIGNLKQWTPFLQWTGQDKPAAAAPEPKTATEDPAAAAVSEQEPSVPDTADELYVADDAERDDETDRAHAPLGLDELFALYPPPPRKSRGLSRRAIKDRARDKEEAWKAEGDDDEPDAPWPASVLNKSTRAEWTALPGSQASSVSLPLLPPATFPTIAPTPLLTPAAAAPVSASAVDAPTVAPAASAASSSTPLVAPDSIPVSSLRAWDFLLFFGCSSWTPRALSDEIEEGTWFLMEGNAHHIFNQHVHIPLAGEAEAQAALQAQKQKQTEAEDARRAARIQQLLGDDDDGAVDEVTMAKVLAATESELLDQGLAHASDATVDVKGKTVAAEPVAPAAADATIAPTSSLPVADAELTSLLQSLEARSDLSADFKRLAPLLTPQQQKNILRLLTAPTAAAADPAALREALNDFVVASVKITSALAESRAIVLDDEKEDAATKEAAAPAASTSEKSAAIAADDSTDDDKVAYPDPLSQRMQHAFSTPVIPQAVYTAVVAGQIAAAQQQQQMQTALPASSSTSEPASTAAAANESAASSALVPLPSAAPVAPLPLSLPPVLFPWQRLWHHALWQLGGEARSWAYLPHQPFENEAAVHEDADDDDWEHEDDDEDHDHEHDDEWDDDDDDDGEH